MKLNEVFNWTTNGIFKNISELSNYTPPWNEEVNSLELDLQYFGNISGNKTTSPLIDKMLINDELSQEKITELSTIIVNIYGKKWGKLWDTLLLEYNPIENYSMTEEETGSNTNTGTVENVRNSTVDNDGITTQTGSNSTTNGGSQTITNTVTYGQTITNADTVSVEQNNNVFAFDNVLATPTTSDTTANTTNGSVEHGGVDETVNKNENSLTVEIASTLNNSIDLTNTENTTDRRTDNLQTATNRTLTRSGNIGVTTSQQMIESERILWQWNFFITVFNDIDNILAVQIY